jgi:hypothetical protein
MLELDQVARLALAGVALSLLLLWAKSPRFRRLLAWRPATALALLGVALSKVAAYLALYHWYEASPPSDTLGYYAGWARELQRGGLPYREVLYQFQPFFGAYLLAAWSLWEDARSFIVAALVCHVVAVWVLWAIARPWLERGRACLLVLLLGCDPLWTGSALMGQDESFAILLTALALLALQKGLRALAGFLLAGQFLATKLVVLLHAVPLALAGGRRAAFAGIVAVVIGYGLVLAAGLDPLLPISGQWTFVEDITHGNLPYLLTLLGIPLLPSLQIYDLLLVVALLAAFFLAGGRRIETLERAALVAAILLLTWALLSRKSWYEELLIPFLPILCGRWFAFVPAYAAWLALATLAALNNSFWFTLMNFGTFADGGSTLFALLNGAQVALKAAILLCLLRRADGSAGGRAQEG